MQSRLIYYGTSNEVRLGDRITIKRLLIRHLAGVDPPPVLWTPR